MSIYAALSKKLWGFLISILMIGCSADETSEFSWRLTLLNRKQLSANLFICLFTPDFIAKLLNRKHLVACGRLSFVAYIVHLNVIKVLHGRAESIELSFAQIVRHSKSLPKSSWTKNSNFADRNDSDDCCNHLLAKFLHPFDSRATG